MIAAADRRGCAPPITGRFAAPERRKADRPQRLHRTRRRNRSTPAGAVYVGRPTLWSNPFEGRPGVGHARSVILYRAWLAGELTPGILSCVGLGEHEIAALGRRRRRLSASLVQLRGLNLQCWCPLTSAWCHADALLDFANRTRPHALEAAGAGVSRPPQTPNSLAPTCDAGAGETAGSKSDPGTTALAPETSNDAIDPPEQAAAI